MVEVNGDLVGDLATAIIIPAKANDDDDCDDDDDDGGDHDDDDEEEEEEEEEEEGAFPKGEGKKEMSRTELDTP
ncbi:hypothetical protein HZH66_012454 [Vespula vulgaris]|uniref:Uncharacterized protein n=1 Tax=Vespula vulgaris TaxID=7454 RepID=A0A834J9B0_VESVU|nr:hypothetical protein HZH66_012454 [Vespula vulgaris]